VLTGLVVNSLLEVKVLVLKCIILRSFIVHTINGAKAYPVSFETHPAMRHLEVPRRYGQNIKDCAEFQQPRGNHSEALHEEACSH
jgi:hypothetical protein